MSRKRNMTDASWQQKRDLERGTHGMKGGSARACNVPEVRRLLFSLKAVEKGADREHMSNQGAGEVMNVWSDRWHGERRSRGPVSPLRFQVDALPARDASLRLLTSDCWPCVVGGLGVSCAVAVAERARLCVGASSRSSPVGQCAGAVVLTARGGEGEADGESKLRVGESFLPAYQPASQPALEAQAQFSTGLRQTAMRCGSNEPLAIHCSVQRSPNRPRFYSRAHRLELVHGADHATCAAS
ncbi:hypothetical protein BDV96DRAFT_223132 [Lophiotrema nucula]|uniref:Uncharacterized protein n=1 Tax=Lophiotrema nucula TaxID=690887 RepID=A0A6A5YT24_9PLEO|nr:hypothetical protein BDV96DRAFT_223132 [Lophiotrema nucula]